jgi:hypothetical protein
VLIPPQLSDIKKGLAESQTKPKERHALRSGQSSDMIFVFLPRNQGKFAYLIYVNIRKTIKKGSFKRFSGGQEAEQAQS